MFVSWFALTGEMAQLAYVAQYVAVLRLMRLGAGGTSSQAEAIRMISEKFAAFAEAQIIGTTAAVTGQLANVAAGKILRNYKKRVRANRRRLSRR